jgi:DNA repair protein RecO (recombination protein O)
MSPFSTPAIILRRTLYGDADLILTLLTPERGKLSVVAKSAKKSVKRFGGVLEILTAIDAVCQVPVRRRGGLPVLQEATSAQPFPSIRSNVIRMAYGSFWAELVCEWTEAGVAQPQIYTLLETTLAALDDGRIDGGPLSIIFLMRFLDSSGFRPRLDQCIRCGLSLDRMPGGRVVVDIEGGGLLCGDCGPAARRSITLAKGTVKQLLWVREGDFRQAVRIRFGPRPLSEGQTFLEGFVPYHLGRPLKSLAFLHRLRTGADYQTPPPPGRTSTA